MSGDGRYWDNDAVAAGLRAARTRWRAARSVHAEHGTSGFPSRYELGKIMDALCGALFPLRLGPSFVRLDNEDAFVAETLHTALSRLYGQIRLDLRYAMNDDAAADRRAEEVIGAFASALPALRGQLDHDVEAAYTGDPAARSVDEVLLCYPGMLAIIHHRLAHRLYELGALLVARIVAEIANSKAGIDIHPGAQIGGSFFIDHGSGVVIGETAVIGERVRLYQAVTLGARSFPIGGDGALEKGRARHPILEDDVVVYAGATLLGRITIGRGSTIGGNVWLTESVPPGSIVRQARLDQVVHHEFLLPQQPDGNGT
ncbi:MAG: serine acetyltransferase [Sphingomonadaceae bacterium]|nr:serine acetyltransferase [Sphingomonadaceae bacterium]